MITDWCYSGNHFLSSQSTITQQKGPACGPDWWTNSAESSAQHNHAACFAMPHPPPSRLLINCLLNTWMQSHNYRRQNDVCTQPPLPDPSSLAAERRPRCEGSGLMISHMSNGIDRRAKKGRNLLQLFHRALDLEPCQDLGCERSSP